MVVIGYRAVKCVRCTLAKEGRHSLRVTFTVNLSDQHTLKELYISFLVKLYVYVNFRNFNTYFQFLIFSFRIFFLFLFYFYFYTCKDLRVWEYLVFPNRSSIFAYSNIRAYFTFLFWLIYFKKLKQISLLFRILSLYFDFNKFY